MNNRTNNKQTHKQTKKHHLHDWSILMHAGSQAGNGTTPDTLALVPLPVNLQGRRTHERNPNSTHHFVNTNYKSASTAAAICLQLFAGSFTTAFAW
jgi:hypothetical protein